MKEMKKQDIEKDTVTVRLNWDKYNLSLLTKKLYNHVEKGEIEFKLNAKRGSLLADLLIKAIDIEITILITLLIEYFLRRVKSEKRKNKKLDTPQMRDFKGEEIRYKQH